MEEPVHFIEIKQDSDDSRADGWHSELAVGQAVLPVSAVVHPTLFDGFVHESVNGNSDGDRPFEQSQMVEFNFRHGVNDWEFVFVHVFSDQFGCCLVGFDDAKRRFIGNVEVALVLQLFLLEERDEFGEDCIEEIDIFLALGGDMPAETFFPVDDDFRGCLGAPLREHVNQFKILESALLCQVQPAFEQREVHVIDAVGFSDSE